ncbi:MAG: hypothetical protein WCQ53_00970 [bacterium]
MKKLIILVSLIISGNSFAVCSIDTQIADLKTKLAGYQTAKDHAWDRYGANCFYIGVNYCWYCDLTDGGDYRLINSDNTVPVKNCDKITCIIADPTTIIGAVLACTGINLPIVDSVQESCRKWCADWHSQDELITSTNQSIADLEATRATVCAPTTPDPCAADANSLKCKCVKAGKTWSDNTNTCCEDSTNIVQCTCEADMKHKWNFTTNACDPMGSGIPDPAAPNAQTYITGNTPKKPGVGNTPSGNAQHAGMGAATTSGMGAVTSGAPAGSGAGGDAAGKSWYDGAVSMYKGKSGDASSNKIKAATSSGDGASITDLENAKKLADKAKNGINKSDMDIFKIVNGMYQRRYYAGLIGENVQQGVTVKPNIKTGTKKPVIYK